VFNCVLSPVTTPSYLQVLPAVFAGGQWAELRGWSADVLRRFGLQASSGEPHPASVCLPTLPAWLLFRFLLAFALVWRALPWLGLVSVVQLWVVTFGIPGIPIIPIIPTHNAHRVTSD